MKQRVSCPLTNDARGASVIEYILLAGAVALACVGAFTAFGGDVSDATRRDGECVSSLSAACVGGASVDVSGEAANATGGGAPGGSEGSSSGGAPGDGVSGTGGGNNPSSPSPNGEGATGESPGGTPAEAPAAGGGGGLAGGPPSVEAAQALHAEALAALAELDNQQSPPTAARANELAGRVVSVAERIEAMKAAAWEAGDVRLAQALDIELAYADSNVFTAHERAGAISFNENTGVDDFVEGFFVDGAWGTLTGLWTAVTNPVDTVTGIWTAVTNPIDTYNAVSTHVATQWEENPTRFSGAIVFEVATLIIAPAKVATAGKVADAAGHAGDLARLATRVPMTRAQEAIARMDPRLGGIDGAAIVGVIDTRTGRIEYANSVPRSWEGPRPDGFLQTNGGHGIMYEQMTGEKVPTRMNPDGVDHIAFTLTQDGIKWKSGSVNDMLSGYVEGPGWLQDAARPILEAEFGDALDPSFWVDPL